MELKKMLKLKKGAESDPKTEVAVDGENELNENTAGTEVQSDSASVPVCVKCGKEFNHIKESVCPHCGHKWADYAAQNDSDLVPGTVLRGYEILQTLGHGGMGTVYLAEQKSMQRKIALKVLKNSVTKDAASVEQFLNEIRNTGKIQHPNIVNAFDAGCDNGVYFLAMNYINGDTLDTIIQQNGALNEIQALEYVLQIAGALEHVWSKYQMYHRDIKPGNIMIDDEGKAMLMDLGIAQKLDEGKSEEDCVEGSPYYMSPEQIQGKKLSWTTDLYSLGATLYQMVVGVPPYDDKTIEDILKKHCLAEFPEPAERQPGSAVSIDTVNLLKKMMNKVPEKRFASWGDFIRDLKELIDLLKDFEANPEKRIQHDAVAMAEAAREKIRKKKAKASIITFSVAAVIILLLAGGYLYVSINNKNTAGLYRLNSGNGQSLLADAYAKFQSSPGNKGELDKCLKAAENAAMSLGVSAEVSKEIMDQVRSYRASSEAFYSNYSDFIRFATQEYKSRSERINREIRKLEQQSRISQDDCSILRDLIANLKGVVERQKPEYSAHQKRLKEIKASVSVMQKDLEKFYAKLKTQSDADAKRTIAQNARLLEEQRQQVLRETQNELAAQSAKVNSEVAQRAAQQRKAEEEQIAKIRAAAMRKPAQVKKVQAAKPVVLSKADLAKLKKEQVRINEDFMRELALLNFKKAADIKISPEIMNFNIAPTDRVAKTEMDKLLKSYEAFHKQSVITLKCWNQLNDLTKGNIFQGMSVRTTDVNRGVGSFSLRIDKIQNGNVYFLESGSVPVKFIDLTMKDKENIAERLARVRRFDITENRIFYFTLGLYNLAYKNCPDEEQKQLEAKIKETVKYQWNLAKKRKDLPMQLRMERDYKGVKVLKSIIR